MDIKKVTVLIVGNDDEEVKSFKINRTLIENFRKYIITAASFLALFVTVIVLFFAYSVKVSFDKNGLLNQLTNVNNKLEEYDSLRIHHKLNTIDNNLAMIDNYLNERGLIETGNAGGEPGTEKEQSNIEKIGYFEKQSVVFYQTLREIPIGYPHYGRISSEYGYRSNPFGGHSSEFHPGIDLKGETGDPVYATADGVIERCDWYGGYGNAVVITHKSGYQSLFGHLSKVNVTQGMEVNSGDLIGFVGSTGRSTGSHLHYEIRKSGEDINPEPFFKLY